MLTLYRRLCKRVDRLRKNHFLYSNMDRSRLQEVIRQNRRSLTLIDNWLPPKLIEQSVFRYGINPEVEHLFNLPLDTQCTLADALAYFGRTSGRPLRYLELGVSVGKTLWQILHACAPCECWAFDIEEINPVLKQHFAQQAREEWPSQPGSIKKTPSSISRFVHPPTGSKLTYICADEFAGKTCG